MHTQSKGLSFKGENIYVGIDIHSKSCSVTILTEYSHHKTFSQPGDVGTLVAYLEFHFPDATYYSADGAGFSGIWVYY